MTPLNKGDYFLKDVYRYVFCYLNIDIRLKKFWERFCELNYIFLHYLKNEIMTGGTYVHTLNVRFFYLRNIDKYYFTGRFIGHSYTKLIDCIFEKQIYPIIYNGEDVEIKERDLVILNKMHKDFIHEMIKNEMRHRNIAYKKLYPKIIENIKKIFEIFKIEDINVENMVDRFFGDIFLNHDNLMCELREKI